MPFKDVDTKLHFRRWSSRWRSGGRSAHYQASLQSGDQAHPFIFFEGPPTANGRPGVHHVEARVTKDLIVRTSGCAGDT